MANEDTHNDSEFTELDNESKEPNYFDNFDSEELSTDPDEEIALPLFPFDEPRTITLKNGTVHNFSIPTLSQVKKKERLQRTFILTSPAIVNGQNPRKIKVDYSRSRIAYYQDIIDTIVGYAFNPGDDPKQVLSGQKILAEGELAEDVLDQRIDRKADKPKPIKLASLIPITHQRAAVERLYGGKIEVVKPVLKDGQKEVAVLNSRRFVDVKQELGVEQNDDGTFSAPEFRMKYRFNEPNSSHLSKWELNCFDGFTINLQKGGSKEERTYNVDACVSLFDSMIDSIEGGSVGGVIADAKNLDHLARIPEEIKVQIIAFVFNDVTTNSGN